ADSPTCSSYCLWPPFASADADAVFQRQYEAFAIADSALRSGAAGLHDGVDGGLNEILINGNLQLNFAEKVDREFVAAVDLGMALLAAEALHVDNGHAKDCHLAQGLLDGLEL